MNYFKIWTSAMDDVFWFRSLIRLIDSRLLQPILELVIPGPNVASIEVRQTHLIIQPRWEP
jgi:hypothetical protein